MRLRALTVIMFCFLITSSFVSIYFSEEGEASGNEIYVDSGLHLTRDGTAENPWASIQGAINKANDGDTIYVFGGTYNETLVINKNITLMGSIDDGETIICRNARHRYTVEITADYVILEGFNVSGAGNRNQVALIYIRSNGVIIQKNNITQSNTYGVYLDSSDDNTIGSNVINNVKGVYLSSSNNNVIHSNKISNCSEAAIYLTPLVNNIIIYGNKLNYNKYGIYALDCSNGNISNNIVNHNSLDGIKLQAGSDIIIANNIICNNGRNGIYLNCLNVFVDNNSIRSSQIGIDLFQSNCNIKNNTIYHCSIYGIYTESGSKDNVFYLNDFANNVKNAKENGNNQWYNVTLQKGNYWDDYGEVDRDPDGTGPLGPDGIGDTSYAINGGGIDPYPLGYFLKPPAQPTYPDPGDGDDAVGLKVTLEVIVSDPDSEKLDVYFYNAVDDTLYGEDHDVENGGTASCSFTLNFSRTFFWYAIVNDGKQENQSGIWFFVTKQRPPLNEKPVADPGGPYVSSKDQIVEFDASDSYDPDGDIDFYRWNFGDGTSEILDITPTHVYTRDDEYTVTLTVVDNNGTSDMATTTVTISDSSVNQDPVANTGGPYSRNAGNAISFNGSSSYDNDGTISSYSWDFGDGSTGIGQTTTHIYTSEGTYIVNLTVTDDGGGTNTASTTVEIYPSSGGGIPGFEIILVIIAIGFIFLSKRRRK